MIKRLFLLPKTVWLIGLISFTNDLASEMIYPLIPLYLASVLMSGPKILGLIEGVAEATASLFKLVSGSFFDKNHKAKPWMLGGYSLAGFGRPLLAFANSWGWVMAIRFVDRIGKGLRSTPRDAMIALSVSPNERGLAYGFHRSLDNAGAVVGPLVAAALLFSGVPLKEVFYWALVPAILVLMLTLLINEVKYEVNPNEIEFKWAFRELPVHLKKYFIVLGLFTLGNSSDMFLLLRAKELGVPQEQIPLLWAGVSFITTIFGAPLSGLSDRLDRKKFIVIAWLAFGFIYFGMGLEGISIWLLLVFFAFYGIFKAATEGVEKALVADLAPPGQAGLAFGWFNLVSGVMLLPASLIFGSLYEIYGPIYAFYFSASLASIAGILMYFWIIKPSDSIPG
jgi:MFS family permease